MHLCTFTADGKGEDILAYELIVVDLKIFAERFIAYDENTTPVLVINRAGDVIYECLKKIRRSGNDL